MSDLLALSILVVAAVLEVGGDAIVRAGLHAPTMAARVGLFGLGGLVLLGYGLVINTPPWDFGRLLGAYVAAVFLVAQMLNFFAFGLRPAAPTLLGGLLIVAGGLLMTFWRSD